MDWTLIWHVVASAALFIMSFRILIVVMYSDQYDNASMWLEILSAFLCVGAVALAATA